MIANGWIDLSLNNRHDITRSLELRDGVLRGLDPHIVRWNISCYNAKRDVGDRGNKAKHVFSQLGRRIAIVVTPRWSPASGICRRVAVCGSTMPYCKLPLSLERTLHLRANFARKSVSVGLIRVHALDSID